MKQSRYSIPVTVFCLVLFFLSSGFLTAGGADAKEIDDFLSRRFPANEPGISVLAVKDGKIVLRKGYGLADLELNIPITPEMVFRIGSITKQFTSAAVMKLVEQGKISLTDEITKFIPDYPVKGEKITVHHLLNHTSGIKSYTSIPSFWKNMRQDLKPLELVDGFKNEAMDFKPGERFLYNNSGYFLLGVIIEKVTGTSYAEYIEETFFKPLGMNNSYYGNAEQIIPNRVSGYEKVEKGFENAPYLSMTLPFAAGSLISTVDDLYLWNEALHSGKVVSQESFKKMTTKTTLNDGKTEDYGYGLSLGTLFKEDFVAHGGGINGFSTFGIRVPAENVFVAVFSNCPGKEPGAAFVAQWITAALCGKEVKEKTAVTLDQKILDDVVGVYQIAKDQTRTISREGDKLFSLRTGSGKMEIFAQSETEFFYKNSFSHFTIVRDKRGKVIKMIMHGVGADEEAIKN